MSLYDYEQSIELSRSNPPFYALVMAAMRQASTVNAARLEKAFPDIWDELLRRYNAPGGRLPEDQ